MILLNCPYCNAVLPKIPQRKTKCKKCGNYYYKRVYPPDINGEEFIVTEAEAKRIDKMWFDYNTANTPSYVFPNPIQNPLTKYEIKLYKIEQYLRYANLFNGKIKVGKKFYSIAELKELREHLKIRIAMEKSNNHLRLIK